MQKLFQIQFFPVLVTAMESSSESSSISHVSFLFHSWGMAVGNHREDAELCGALWEANAGLPAYNKSIQKDYSGIALAESHTNHRPGVINDGALSH